MIDTSLEGVCPVPVRFAYRFGAGRPLPTLYQVLIDGESLGSTQNRQTVEIRPECSSQEGEVAFLRNRGWNPGGFQMWNFFNYHA
jgi:hypothetical protein